MAGKFIIAAYERDDDTVGPIRVQPETITSWNPEATGSLEGFRLVGLRSPMVFMHDR